MNMTIIMSYRTLPRAGYITTFYQLAVEQSTLSLSIRVGKEHNISIVCHSGGSWMKFRKFSEFNFSFFSFSFLRQYCSLCTAMLSDVTEHLGQITVHCLLQSLPMMFMAVWQWYFGIVFERQYSQIKHGVYLVCMSSRLHKLGV